MKAYPALLTRTSISLLTDSWATTSEAAGLPGSRWSHIALLPWNSGKDLWAFGTSREVPMTLWPEFKAANARDLPKPEEAPVMSHVN